MGLYLASNIDLKYSPLPIESNFGKMTYNIERSIKNIITNVLVKHWNWNRHTDDQSNAFFPDHRSPKTWKQCCETL